ncbi:MAG: DUF4982 domain-containing protein [Tannerella sp.]|jgi:hypothetical protein|nr:DUF4982 domain-containing protein [Tannerella sp.]
MKKYLTAIIFAAFTSLSFAGKHGALAATTDANQRERYNFNSDWEMSVGDTLQGWTRVTLPRAFNEDEAFRVSIKEHTDTIIWYRKYFRLPKSAKDRKIFLEFEGIKWGGEFWVNGKYVGLHENGVMAFGFDITEAVNFSGDNLVLARIDNSWRYREKATGSPYQWNDSNFNANYGGITKNVYLHVAPLLYQTLPLYSNLHTTGTYIYAREIDVTERRAMIFAETEVRNEFPAERDFILEMRIEDLEGKTIASVESPLQKIAPGETKTIRIGQRADNLRFWSWGYGYMYNVYTAIKAKGIVDEVKTRTGFRKTRFADGMIWLNDRVIQIKGYAERTSNEWVAVGVDAPAWLSDYGNGMMVEGNANTVRWMHVTPARQDVESCDRVGLMQVMPAGDAERDVNDRRWGQRVELMRDAIIYYRNNPSIVFYEGGNESISEAHMQELKDLRDKYDPYGGRAIGSREMLDSKVAEYGGEMLYINKSAHIPMFATEYCRDEALRLYWDNDSYPFHIDGEGLRWSNSFDTDASKPLTDAAAYNRNQDSFLKELITRWNDYYRVRPGTGTRVSSGGLKIHFHDSNTHWRGAENYRRSGVVDAMRIPKDAFFAHRVMWNGWVDIEQHGTYICGHWNYESTGQKLSKDVYVCSTGEKVELFINGKSHGFGNRSDNFLFTFKDVTFEPGAIEAVSYNENGEFLSSDKKESAGAPYALKLMPMTAPDGFKADGADLALIQIEVVDKDGRRCPLDNSMVTFDLQGEAQWLGGMAKGEDGNFVGKKSLPVECGVNRVLIRSTTKAGKIRLSASANVAANALNSQLELQTVAFKTSGGLSSYMPADCLPVNLFRGETPMTPSYSLKRKAVEIVGATAGANETTVSNAFDDNELSEWKNDDTQQTGWIKFELARDAVVSQVEMKLTGWRSRSYSIRILVGDETVWEGETPKSLGYICIPFKPVKGRFVTIELIGQSSEEDAFGGIVEVEAKQAGELDLYRNPAAAEIKGALRIVEMEVYEEKTRFSKILF